MIVFDVKGEGKMAGLLSELKTLLTALGFSLATAAYEADPPDEYVVISPTRDTFLGYADNAPRFESQSAQINLYKRGNYLGRKNELTGALMRNLYKIQVRRYEGFDPNTGLHCYVISVLKVYGLEAY